jgi:hypothetical protein
MGFGKRVLGHTGASRTPKGIKTMALHRNMASMASEVIEEYLRASQFCLEFRNFDGGCLGYPATLLLLCVTNALGSYLTGEDVAIEGKQQKITRGEPFRVLNHTLFGLQLTHKQIKLIEQFYRNRLSHNAIIERGSFILPAQGGTPFVFSGNHVLVRIASFERLVSKVWAKFPKEQIALWEQRQPGYQKAAIEILKLSSPDELLPEKLRALKRSYERTKKKAH